MVPGSLVVQSTVELAGCSFRGGAECRFQRCRDMSGIHEAHPVTPRDLEAV